LRDGVLKIKWREATQLNLLSDVLIVSRLCCARNYGNLPALQASAASSFVIVKGFSKKGKGQILL
jgi:hypothetical protein